YDSAYCYKAYMEEGARKFHFCGRNVYGSIELGSSQVMLLKEDQGTWALQGYGEGDLVVWPEGWDYGHQVQRGDVLGWAPDGKGIRRLLWGMPRTTCATALSDTHMVGFTVDRKYGGGCVNSQENPGFWVAPRTYELLPAPYPEIHPIPLPGRVWLDGLQGIRTWGNFLAVALTID